MIPVYLLLCCFGTVLSISSICFCFSSPTDMPLLLSPLQSSAKLHTTSVKGPAFRDTDWWCCMQRNAVQSNIRKSRSCPRRTKNLQVRTLLLWGGRGVLLGFTDIFMLLGCCCFFWGGGWIGCFCFILCFLLEKQTGDNSKTLFYVLFLQIGVHSPLQSKEPKHSQTISLEHVCRHTHTHTQ